MTDVRRIRSASYVEARSWAVLTGTPIPTGGVLFYGLAPGSLTVTEGDPSSGVVFAVGVSAGLRSIAVSRSVAQEPVLWLAGPGVLEQRDGQTGALTASAAAAVDGRVVTAIQESGVQRVYATASDGRLQRFTGLVRQYGSALADVIVALVPRDLVLYALTDEGDLLTLVEDPVRGVFREEARLHLPQTHGFRDIIDAGTALGVVGYDRQGEGAVVLVSLADPLAPALTSADRTHAASLILTTDGEGLVGTVLPQTPDTLEDIPWSGRTDYLRRGADGVVLVARPTLGEVWIVRADALLLVQGGIQLTHNGVDLAYSL